MYWGTDVMGWAWYIKLVILGIMLVFVGYLGYKVVAISSKQKIDVNIKKRIVKHYMKLLAISLVLGIAYFLAAFVFFHPGRPTIITSANKDGTRILVEKAPELPTPEEIKKDQSDRKDDYLKKLDQGPEQARKESEEYLRKVLERRNQ